MPLGWDWGQESDISRNGNRAVFENENMEKCPLIPESTQEDRRGSQLLVSMNMRLENTQDWPRLVGGREVPA